MPEGVNRTWALQQIEGYQLAKRKLPQWASIFAEGKDLHFPPRLSMEQCSSEATARYKGSIIQRLVGDNTCSLTDLTGGYGIDFSYMARHVGRSVYVERNEELCNIARHNFSLLGLSNAEVINADCENYLTQLSDNNNAPFTSPTIIFLDPARRDSAGGKVFAIEDCTPNLVMLQDSLLDIADTVMVKLSPMLDITQALRTLRNVSDVHIVSVKGECKELLFIMHKEAPTSLTYHCVNLETEEEIFQHDVTSEFRHNDMPVCRYAEPGNILFEPNASIMKAGVQDAFGNRYGLRKLHPNSNLYIGDAPIDLVPARQFRIVAVSDFSKKGLKNLLGDIEQANLTVRNFPSTTDALRRKLKIKEGGSVYLFATTLHDGSHVLIRCSK